MNTKKIFIVAIILFGLAVAALLIYNLFLKNPVSPAASPSGSGNPTASQTPGLNSTDSRLRPISQERAFGATMSEDGQSVKYFLRSNGHIWQVDFNGKNSKEISPTTLVGLIKAIWSPDKEKIIGVFQESDRLKKYFYDYKSGQTSPLPEKVGFIAWSPDSKKITYQFDPIAPESAISVANPDGTNYKNIFKTRLNNLLMEWPSIQKISLATSISGLAQGLIYSIDSQSGDFSKVLSDYFGLSAKWSPKADRLVFSSTNGEGKNLALALADEKGDNTKNLKIATIAEKCVWSKDDRTIFCAVPQEISSYAVWPDDYYKGKIIVSDDFYKINLETDEKTKIAGSSALAGYDARDLFLSPKEDFLFFINQKDGLLYSLAL